MNLPSPSSGKLRNGIREPQDKDRGRLLSREQIRLPTPCFFNGLLEGLLVPICASWQAKEQWDRHVETWLAKATLSLGYLEGCNPVCPSLRDGRPPYLDRGRA